MSRKKTASHFEAVRCVFPVCPVSVASRCVSVFQVCYTERKYIQVRVHSEIFDPLTQQHKTTNTFHFTFVSDGDVPNIIPKTYGGERTVKRSMRDMCLCVSQAYLWM